MTAGIYTESVFDWSGWLELNIPDAVKVYGTEDEYLILCPFHSDSNPSCAVNTHKACFVCRSCGTKGSMKALRQKVGGSAPDVSVSAEVLRRKFQEAGCAKEELPRYVGSWLERYSPDTGYWTEIRGLLPATVKRYDLRIDEVNREAIIPVYWQGELRGVIRRCLGVPKLVHGVRQPKYKFPKHLPRRELLWGHDEAMKLKPRGPIAGDRRFGDNPVVVTEGQVDAIAVSETGVRAVGLGGNLLLKTQRMHLRRMNPSCVIIGLDSDTAGRGHARVDKDHGPTGVHQVAQMCGAWTTVFVVDWDPFKDAADVSDLPERIEMILDARPYREWRKR